MITIVIAASTATLVLGFVLGLAVGIIWTNSEVNKLIGRHF